MRQTIKQNTSQNKRQKGMTLLEVLIAMTLMVVIAAIAFASLNGLIDAKNHTDIVANNLRQELLTSQQLNKDFHAMIDREVKDSLGSVKVSILGRYSSIEFSRNGHSNPLKQNRSELQRVQWFLKDQQLVRASMDQIDPGPSNQWRFRTYMDDVDELNINYVNRAGQQSRSWPIANNNATLHYIELSLTLSDRTKLEYLLRPIL